MRARPATAGDYDEFGRFFAELSPSDPPPPREWWDRFHGNALFLEDEGALVAYGHGYPLGEKLAYVLYVVVAPQVRNRRVGRLLMSALAEQLRAAGCTEWSLNVVSSNEPAIALYRRLGMDVAHTTELLTVPWTAIASLPREDLAVEELRSEDDAEIERAFGLTAGRLTTSRQMPGRVYKRTSGGFMVFDPTFPIAAHFRARNPAIARALLEAVRDRCTPAQTDVRVNVEDSALLAAFRAAGAEVLKTLLHLRGPLPPIQPPSARTSSARE